MRARCRNLCIIWDFLIYCQQAEAADAAERAEGNDYMVKTHGLTGLLLALLLLAAPARAAEKNTVVIGCDVYAPYTYKDGTGDFIGIDVQLAHEAFGRLGYNVEFREIAWENKDKALASGEVGLHMELLYDERARGRSTHGRGRICTAGRSRWCARTAIIPS